MAAHINGDPTVYATIQAAVDAAAPGAVINVDAGSYSEQISINKSLTLRGAQAGVDARSNLRASGTNESVITGIDLGGGKISNALYIAANDVTIDGFTVQGNTSSDVMRGAGIVIAPHMSGAHILDNIIQNNVAGLFLANSSASDAAIIQHNVFRSNNNDGPNGGRGIYTDGGISGGTLTNVVIDANAFFNNSGGSGTTGLEAAIALESQTLNSQTNLQITNNVFDSNGKALLAYAASGLLIQGNVVSNSLDYFSAALRFEGGVSNVSILNNTLYNNPGPAIRIDEKAVIASNANFTIKNNNIYGNDFHFGTKTAIIVDPNDYASATLDARGNWWGDPSGPSNDGDGTGDGIAADGNPVNFSTSAFAPIGSDSTPFFGLPQSLDGTIQVEDLNAGGEGNADHNWTTTNAGGLYRASANVGIGAATDAGNGYYVGWTSPGEWLDYSVIASTSGTYTVSFRVSNAQTTATTFHLEIDGVNVTGAMSIAPTGGWQNWTTISAGGIALSAGPHTLRLLMDAQGNAGSSGNFNWMQFTNTSLLPLPTAPGNLIANASGSVVGLAWTDNSTSESGFIIDRQINGGAWQQFATTLSNVNTFVDSAVTPGTSYSYRVRATNTTGDSLESNIASVTTQTPAVNSYLSDLPFAQTPTNGFGPVERDMSNGGSAAGDGGTITLNGVTYAKGLGVHGLADITYNLNGGYTQFFSDIGIDDEEAAGGSVTFQVFADGVKVYDSGVMTADTDTQHIALNVTGVQQFRLRMDDANDGVTYDHGDWAGARLSTAPISTTLAAPNSLVATAVSSTQIRLTWADGGVNESGFLIERSTDGKHFAQIASVGANVTHYADNDVLAGKNYFYRVSATANGTVSGYSNVSKAMALAVTPYTYLSDIPASGGSVGWGAIHNDLTVKGNPITIRGVTYAKGVGTHASSTIVYNLNGLYTTFSADVGIDDEVSGKGSIEFRVVGDGHVLFDSGVLTGTSAVRHFNVSVRGIRQLAIVSINATPDDIDYDHADWGNAVLSAGRAGPSVGSVNFPLAPNQLTATAIAKNKIQLNWADNSANETGFLIYRKTATGKWTQVGKAKANATSVVDNKAKPGQTYAYKIVAINKLGNSGYSNITNVKTPMDNSLIAKIISLL